MPLRQRIEALYRKHVAAFTAGPDFVAFEKGTAPLEAYDRFLSHVVRYHLRAPQALAFLFALAPPDAAPDLLRKLLEELGTADAASEPGMLRELARGAGLGPALPELEGLAAQDMRQVAVEPLLYGTLKEVGLAALCELVAFEYLLSRTARRIATALAVHRGLSAETLEWFGYRSEADVQQAERGLDALVAYADFYDLDDDEAFTICEMALRENPFSKRYFGESAGVAKGLVEN